MRKSSIFKKKNEISNPFLKPWSELKISVLINLIGTNCLFLNYLHKFLNVFHNV